MVPVYFFFLKKKILRIFFILQKTRFYFILQNNNNNANNNYLVQKQQIERSSGFNAEQFAHKHVCFEQLAHVERQNNGNHHWQAFRNSHHNNDDGKNERSHNILQSQLPVASVSNNLSPLDYFLKKNRNKNEF